MRLLIAEQRSFPGRSIPEQSIAAQTRELRRRGISASMFPASAVARFAWTSLPHRGAARPRTPEQLQAGKARAAGLETRKEGHPRPAANHAPASSLLELQIRLWAVAKLLQAT